MKQNNNTMKEVIFKTKAGSHLYFSEEKFYSENPDDVLMALALDASRPNPIQTVAYNMLQLVRIAGITKI